MDIELINDKGPLATKVSTFGLRLDAIEMSRATQEKETLSEVSDLKKGTYFTQFIWFNLEMKHYQLKTTRMIELMNTYDKQQNDRSHGNCFTFVKLIIFVIVENLNIKKKWEEHKHELHTILNEIKQNQEEFKKDIDRRFRDLEDKVNQNDARYDTVKVDINAAKEYHQKGDTLFEAISKKGKFIKVLHM